MSSALARQAYYLRIPENGSADFSVYDFRVEERLGRPYVIDLTLTSPQADFIVSAGNVLALAPGEVFKSGSLSPKASRIGPTFPASCTTASIRIMCPIPGTPATSSAPAIGRDNIGA